MREFVKFVFVFVFVFVKFVFVSTTFVKFADARQIAKNLMFYNMREKAIKKLFTACLDEMEEFIIIQKAIYFCPFKFKKSQIISLLNWIIAVSHNFFSENVTKKFLEGMFQKRVKVHVSSMNEESFSF